MTKLIKSRLSLEEMAQLEKLGEVEFVKTTTDAHYLAIYNGRYYLIEYDKKSYVDLGSVIMRRE